MRGLLQLLQLLRDVFISLTKNILEKENALNFYADLIFCLFISIFLNKNVKETKFFENNSCGLCCYKVLFSAGFIQI